MSSARDTEPGITLSKRAARRFLLAHLHLWPPRSLKGKQAIHDFIRHVGCIQYDPINVVGRNPDLVLQSRIKNYRTHHLNDLLYQDRKLLDGYDKVQSIYDVGDWPYFSRFRERMREKHGKPSNPPMKIAPRVLETIRERGPLSSIDFKNAETIDWWWGVPARMPRAALELLYFMGHVNVHHRVNTRRVFELTERLLPKDLLERPDPNNSLQAYQEWHVLRRVGGLGIANPGGTDHWLDMNNMKSGQRREILRLLMERGKLQAVKLEGFPDRTFYIRARDLPTLDTVQSKRAPKAKAAFIAPMDNLMWDRDMIRLLFNFDYTWEIYKPAAQRQYGYYVLPVLYGDKFIARFEPQYDKQTRLLTIKGWWWENGVRADDRVERALLACLGEFMGYLSARQIAIQKEISRAEPLYRVAEILNSAG